MQEIIIDEEFKNLLPPLDATTHAWLEENILQHGCREPLVLWEGILIDGHNRYEISRKHGIPFNTVNMEFDSRDDVMIWIISTQVSRRNLSPTQLSFFRGLHYITDKRARGGNRFTQSKPKYHSDTLNELGDTAARLAEEYNVSPITIKRDAQAAAGILAIGEASPEAKRDILAERTRISRKRLRELSAGPEDDIIEVALEIENGTFGISEPITSASAEERVPIDSIPGEFLQLEQEFNRVADDFRLELQGLLRSGDASALQPIFRVFIDTMEGLYNNYVITI